MISVDSDPKLIVRGYQEFVEEKIQEGWTPYVLTFMFKQINGSPTTVLTRIGKELERIYATMLTRIIRNPTSASANGQLPIWIGCPDFPVPKHARQSLASVIINDGLHVHAVALIPPKSRLKEPLSTHLRTNQGLYVGHREMVGRIRADLIDSSPGYVTGYLLKSISRRRCDTDRILVFPRSLTELNDGADADS
jgi:hypothetical protein